MANTGGTIYAKGAPMDPQLTALLQALHDTTQALAWHATLQTYLIIGLVALTVVGFWSMARDMRALGRLANAIAQRLETRP